MTTPLDPAAALLQSAAVREHAELSVVRVKGDDRATWLNGQITNDVRDIAPGTSVHALAVNVRGKILAELWVTAREDELWLLCPTRAQTSLLESFERYIIMEDVELAPWPQARLISLEGPRSSALQAELTAASHASTLGGVHGFAFAPLGPEGFPGYAWVGSDDQLAPLRELLSRLAPTADDAAFELARLRLGLPRYGSDYDEHQYPQEAGLKASVSFQKGCYLGQEVVCTLESRGRLSRQLCSLLAAEPDAEGGKLQPGEAITLPAGDAVGAITSATWDPELGRTRALGYVKRAHASAGTSVQAGRQLFTIEKLVGTAA